jgi:hypothetical protein
VEFNRIDESKSKSKQNNFERKRNKATKTKIKAAISNKNKFTYAQALTCAYENSFLLFKFFFIKTSYQLIQVHAKKTQIKVAIAACWRLN